MTVHKAIREPVLNALKDGPGTATEIAVELARKPKSTWMLLKEMALEGRLKHRRGIFSLPDEEYV